MIQLDDSRCSLNKLRSLSQGDVNVVNDHKHR